MWKKKKALSVSLAAVLSASVLVAGCGKTEGETGASDGKEPANKQQEKIKLSMFMSNSGLKHPDGIVPNENEFINIIKDYANVDLDLEVPNAADEATKLNLLLASANLPDILHSRSIEATYDAARQGAFIDLQKYYDKSPIVQKYITPEMMELAKDPQTGKLWRIPMSTAQAPQGYGNVVRMDLLKKYNEGKMPESVEEWVDVLRKLKKAEPESVPLSNRVIGDYGFSYGGNVVFQWFGVRPYNFRVEDGKVINEFRTPEFKAAVELLKQLYGEGILDKEFAAKDAAKYGVDLTQKNTLLYSDTTEQLIGTATGRLANPDLKNQQLIMAPPLKKLPSVVKDAKYLEAKRSVPINTHGIYISSKSKDPDRAWKVIEGFASDQLRESIFWGKEGETYTVKDGKRVPDTAKLNDPKRYWSLQLAIVFGFSDGQEVKQAKLAQVAEPEHYKALMDSQIAADKNALKTGFGVTSFIDLPNDLSKKLPDSRMYITQAAVEAIMGKITMDEFDNRVKGYVEKYGAIDDFYTKEMNGRKDELRKKGVVEVDW
ncbi:hypothetical protein [Paenibacillus contaminans]|uniref:ABC transporter substrate-binding protein n=1 Tax=Paenibacillus contaminans TaxID=450362 RepID=A0A329MP16_9BACL|nr:hypothetical protein [Paenibacillus contaminans]RAV21066.1 hypothetical protein DQG23_13385 [Paenibacillus contaminans]